MCLYQGYYPLGDESHGLVITQISLVSFIAQRPC
jgi:hypothetical protein